MGQASCTHVECRPFGDMEASFDLQGAPCDRAAAVKWDVGDDMEGPADGRSGGVRGRSADEPGPIFAAMPGGRAGRGTSPNPSPGASPPWVQGSLHSLTQQFGRPSARNPIGELSQLPGPEAGDGLDDCEEQLRHLRGRWKTKHRQLSPLEDCPLADDGEAHAKMSVPRLPKLAQEVVLSAPAAAGEAAGGVGSAAQTLLQARLPLRFDELKVKRSTSYQPSEDDSPASSSKEDDFSDVACESTEADGPCGGYSSQDQSDSDAFSVPASGASSAVRAVVTGAEQPGAMAKMRIPALELSSVTGAPGKAEDVNKHGFKKRGALTSSTLAPQDDPANLKGQRDELIMKEIRNEREAQQRVRAFLKSHGFRGVCAKKRRLMGFAFPLHVAVSQNDAGMVLALLKAGADPRQTDSSGRTPYQLALLREDGRGSHTHVLSALSKAGAAVAPRTVVVGSATGPPTPVPCVQGRLIKSWSSPGTGA